MLDSLVNSAAPVDAPATTAPVAASLATKAMLSTLTIRAWSARKLDKEVSAEVNASHNANADAGRYTKALVDKAAMETLKGVASRARTLFYERSLPWLDSGLRILSARGYVEYSEKIRALQAEFNSAVTSFVATYNAHVDAAKLALNGLFKAADYPSESEIRDRFEFRFQFMPCPDAGDWRVDLSAAQVETLTADLVARQKEQLAAATRDVYGRIAETVARMADRLKAYKPSNKTDKAQGVFRDSLVENVRELVDLLPSLNLTGDANLSAIAARMARELCAEDAKSLRENDKARESVAASAAAILEQVGAFMA